MAAIPLAGLRAEAKFSNFEIWRRPDCISPPNGAWAMGLASGLGSRSVDPLNGHTTGFLGGLGLLGGLAGSSAQWGFATRSSIFLGRIDAYGRRRPLGSVELRTRL